MPRVAGLNHKYRIRDITAYIRGQMLVQGITETEMAEELGITQQALSYKLTNHSYKIDDILLIFRRLETPDEEKLRLMKL